LRNGKHNRQPLTCSNSRSAIRNRHIFRSDGRAIWGLELGEVAFHTLPHAALSRMIAPGVNDSSTPRNWSDAPQLSAVELHNLD